MFCSFREKFKRFVIVLQIFWTVKSYSSQVYHAIWIVMVVCSLVVPHSSYIYIFYGTSPLFKTKA